MFVGGGHAGPTEADERRHGNGSGHRHERHQAEEHPAPAEQVGHRGRDARAEDARDHPGGRQDRHHPGPLDLAQAPADGHVGHRRYCSRAETLEAAPGDEYPHERGEARHEQAGREQHQSRDVGAGRSVAVGGAPGDDDPDQTGQLEGREDPAVERQPVEVTGHDRHDGDDGQRLDGDEGHGEDEPEREGAAMGRPQPVARGCPVHRGETTATGRWYSAPGGPMALQTIDVDQHLFESRTTWSEHIEPAHRSDALSISDDEAGWPWLTWRGSRLTPLEVPIPERSTLIGQDRLRRLRGERAPASFDDLVPDSYHLAGARLASLDGFGLDAAVMFPNYGLLWEQRLASDRAAQRANARAYNRFVAEVCGEGDGRLFGVAHLLLHDPRWAVEEITRVRAQGIRLAMVAPAPVDGKPLSHPDFDPVWAAFSDQGVAPVFHVSEFESPLHPAWRVGEQEDGEQLFDSIFLYLAPAVALANLILNGVLERFPRLRIGVVELTASWVPSFLLHIDGASDFYTQRHGEPFRATGGPSVGVLLTPGPGRLPAVRDAEPTRPEGGRRHVHDRKRLAACRGRRRPHGGRGAGCGRAGRPRSGEHPGSQRRLAPRLVTIDLEAAAAERERLRTTYLQEVGRRPTSTARGVHHLALLCSDVERTIRFYQELLGFPLVELFENRDYQGSTHLFFDLGHDNTLAFFDFPGLGLGPYTEVLGGFHHLAISVERERWDAARARLEEAGVPTQVESEVSLYFSDPDGARLELIAEDLGSLYGTPLH